MNHYTYLVQYEDGMLYHGVRSYEGDIEDDRYIGSSRYTPDDQAVTKHLITTHDTREEAMKEEVWYHKEYDVKSHDDYHNRGNQSSEGFDMTGVTSPMKGKKHSKESLNKISETSKGRTPSKETKEKIRKSMEGRHKGDKNSMSNPKWQRTCEHCDKTLSKSNHNRWHGDNCKLRKEKSNG